MRKNTKRSIDRESDKKTQKKYDGVKPEDDVATFDFANMVGRWLGRDRHWSSPIYLRDTLRELSRLCEGGRTVRGRNLTVLLNKGTVFFFPEKFVLCTFREYRMNE